MNGMVSTKETAEMERAIGALALELPGEVWDDVRAKWHAARDSLGGSMKRLRRDGHGIDRVPYEVTVGGEQVGFVVVRADDLEALEDVAFDLRDVVAVCSPDGMDWDKAEDREQLFADAEKAWRKSLSVLRGDDASFED